MQKNPRKKNFTSKSPKSTFRQQDDFHSENRNTEKKTSGKKFFSSKRRDEGFGGGWFPKEDNRGFDSGKKQYRENYRDDRQQPKPLYSTGGKKKFFRDEEPRPFRAKKDFNPKFSGRRNDEGDFRGGNPGRRTDNFKDESSFKKPKPFLRSEKQDGFSRGDDAKNFQPKKDFVSKPPHRSSDDVKPFREKKDFVSKPLRRNSDEGKHRERRDEPRPFLRKKNFNPKFSGKRNDNSPQTSNFKLQTSNFKPQTSNYKRQSDYHRDDARPFREKRGFDAKFHGKKPFRKIKGKRTTKTATAQMLNEPARLNKYLAHAGIASRRESDELIKSGYVTVNGQVVLEMGHKVQPGDEVRFKNRIITPESKVYILLNKPKDYITTVSDERGRPTVMKLIENATDMRIYPVGRLDRNTTGLLLLTNDGELAQKLTHPSFEAKKVYLASLDKPLKKEDMQLIAEGVMLEEGKAMVDAIEYADPRDKRKIGIELHIGWNKVVRRIFDALDYEVVQLDRVYYAGLTKDVPRGKWRPLTEKEVIMLKHFTK